MKGNEPKAIFLTGYPSNLIARRLLEKIVGDDGAKPLICATPASSMPAARAHLATLSERARASVRLRPYDITAMDFGLTGDDFFQLAREVETIHHCASTVRSGMDRAAADRINVRATGEVLELAKAASGLKQLVFWSSALVSGCRQGLVMEDDLVRPSGFRSAAEQGVYRAEKLLRDVMDQVPVTVLRPSLVIENAKNSEVEPFEEPHLLIQFILNSPADMPLLLPKRGEIPLHVVPVGFVVDAGWAISNDPQSVGRAFHLVDPNPLKVSEVVKLVSKAVGKSCEVGELPTALATALLRAPGLSRWLEMPRALLEQLASNVVYDTSNTSELLQREHIECPPLPSYLDLIIERAKSPT
jgi:nucleoside-diphosphate-sugar epimerase